MPSEATYKGTFDVHEVGIVQLHVFDSGDAVLCNREGLPLCYWDEGIEMSKENLRRILRGDEDGSESE